MNEVVRPALTRGAAVVSDRFFDSTTAYQGYARGLDPAIVAQANLLACGDVMPDRTILLDLDPTDALTRAATDHEADRIEREGVAFQQRVRAGFAAVALSNPERVRVIDATGSVAQVWDRVRAVLADLVKLPALDGNGSDHDRG